MINVSCLKARAMSDLNQRLMQAFVDEVPHALLSKALSGARAILSLLKVG